jgi:hypothetical protein
MNCSPLTRFVLTSIQPTQTISFALIKIALVLFVLLAADTMVIAQEPSTSPAPTATASPTAEELRLQAENRLLELKKTNAELKKDIRETQPEPSSTPLAGKTTADENVVIETQLVTFKAMSDIADRIGVEIHQKFGDANAIAIYDADEIENLKHYRTTSPILQARIQSLKDQYQRVLRSLAAIPPLTTPTIASAKQSTAKKSLSKITAETEVVKSLVNSMVAPGSTPLANVMGPIGAATTGLKVFADLLALLRTDTDIKGKSVSVEESAMVAETFRALRNRFGTGVSLYYPKVVSPETCPDRAAPAFCSATLNSLADLYSEKEIADAELQRDMFDVAVQVDKLTRQKTQAEGTIASLAKHIAELKLERLKAELEKPWTLVQIARFESYMKDLETMKRDALSARTTAESYLESAAKRKNVLEQIQLLNQQADQFVANLVKPDEKSGRSELANFMRAENMDKALGDKGYWLSFNSISAGGNNRTRSNLFRYFSGAKLDHSGGLVVEWALYNRNGVSVDSNKDSSYGGYMTPKELQSTKFKDAVADPTPEAAGSSRVLASSKNQ